MSKSVSDHHYAVYETHSNGSDCLVAFTRTAAQASQFVLRKQKEEGNFDSYLIKPVFGVTVVGFK